MTSEQWKEGFWSYAFFIERTRSRNPFQTKMTDIRVLAGFDDSCQKEQIRFADLSGRNGRREPTNEDDEYDDGGSIL